MTRPTQKRMVDELISSGVLRTPAIVSAFRAIDRADFVSPEWRQEQYLNVPLPIGFGQTISQPYTVAFMLELLQPQRGEIILDIGSGSGWQTALLAYLVSTAGESRKSHSPTHRPGKVVALEIIPELHKTGVENVSKYNFLDKGIVEMYCLSGLSGYPRAAPFDKIIAAAAGETVSPAWQEQLKTGGRIVTPVGSSILLLEKLRGNQWRRKDFPGFAFVPLVDN